MTPTLACLALAIYFEARNQPTSGKVAVAQVVLNRARHPGFPDDVCDVVKQGGETRWRCQFSFWCDGIPDRPYNAEAWADSVRIANSVLNGRNGLVDFDEVLWYHARYVTPYWAQQMRVRAVIGDHVFYEATK